MVTMKCENLALKKSYFSMTDWVLCINLLVIVPLTWTSFLWQMITLYIFKILFYFKWYLDLKILLSLVREEVSNGYFECYWKTLMVNLKLDSLLLITVKEILAIKAIQLLSFLFLRTPDKSVCRSRSNS